jgi:O-antigen/teichoic acid export membrane protein
MKLNILWRRIRSSQLINAGLWYLSLSIIQKAISFLSVIMFVRLLTPEQYGITTVFSSWVGIFATIITLNVMTSIARAKFDSEIADYNRFLSSLVALGMFSGLICALVIAGLPGHLVTSIFGLEKSYVLLAAFTVIGSLGLDAAALTWQMEYKYKKYSFVKILQAILSVLLPLALIVSPLSPLINDPAWAKVLGTSTIGIWFGLAYATYQLWHGKSVIHKRYWTYGLLFSVPLIPHVLSGIILAHSDRILISNYSGKADAGLYALAYQLGELVSMVWIATNTAWSPWFIRKMSEQSYALIEHRSTQYLRLFSGLVILMIMVGPILIRIAPAQYWTGAPIIPLVMSSQFFTLLYSFYANVELYEKRTIYVSSATIAASIVNFVLNVILLPRFGYIAAAWTTLISYIVLFLTHAWIVKSLIRPPRLYNFREMLFWSGLILVLTMFVYRLAFDLQH